jgi:hypothetical protein
MKRKILTVLVTLFIVALGLVLISSDARVSKLMEHTGSYLSRFFD